MTSKKVKIIEFSIILLLILFGVTLRLLPHAPNFTPILAIALFGGFYFTKKIALILPITAMAVSDVFIGYYASELMIAVYGSFILCVLLGLWLKKNKRWQTVLGGSLLAAIIFFFVTNFAVWAFTPWYAKTFEGIIQCYFMALPFFRNTLLGTLFYVTIFFGAYEMVKVWVKSCLLKEVKYEKI